jgi:cytochrome P450
LSGVTVASDLYWDPLDTEIDADPHPIWRRMRDEAPVYRNERYDFWALSRFHDVEAAHRDPVTYSSAHGTVLEMMTPALMTDAIINMDPPQHTELRALVSRAFTPRRIRALEERIRAVCAELLDPHVGSSEFDYVVDFGAQLPSRVISMLLGVPESEREEQRQNIDLIFHIEPDVGMFNDVSIGARIALQEYLAGLAARKRVNPDDDLISLLCEHLDDNEMATFCNLLFAAGTETVARLLGNAAVLLAEVPDQRKILAVEPELCANGVEELLRYEAPSPVQGRWTTKQVTVHGVEVPKDSKILLLTGSAGRDERVFPDPDRFDVRRTIDHHVSFGYGIHFCVGAYLARMEGKVALEETLKRFPEWEVEPGAAVRQHTSTVRGYMSVPIRV